MKTVDHVIKILKVHDFGHDHLSLSTVCLWLDDHRMPLSCPPWFASTAHILIWWWWHREYTSTDIVWRHCSCNCRCFFSVLWLAGWLAWLARCVHHPSAVQNSLNAIAVWDSMPWFANATRISDDSSKARTEHFITRECKCRKASRDLPMVTKYNRTIQKGRMTDPLACGQDEGCTFLSAAMKSQKMQFDTLQHNTNAHFVVFRKLRF